MEMIMQHLPIPNNWQMISKELSKNTPPDLLNTTLKESNVSLRANATVALSIE
jgi:hypothetical protein